jgi:quercetin dioxygenase-like cupin family protein
LELKKEASLSVTATANVDQPLAFFSNLARIRVDGGAEGPLDVVELEGTRGDMPPLHVHHREDEYFVVLEGEMTLLAPGGSRTLSAGQAAHAPRGVPHAYRVESERARWLALSAPAGFSSFVAEVSEPSSSAKLPAADRAVDVERIDAVAAAHRIEILGPPGTLP